MTFDLVVSGGTVVDPANGLSGSYDVAVHRGRIAAIDPSIPEESAITRIDATDKIVTAGLIDLHTHIYPGGTYWGVEPDLWAWRTGVTTWIDAGSTGAYNFPSFKRDILERLRVNAGAFINVSAAGLVAETGEASRRDLLSSKLIEGTCGTHPDDIVGIKVRIGAPIVGDLGLEPLRIAQEAGDRCGRPVMVHISYAPPAIDEVLHLLRPGDILTHCFTGLSMSLLDSSGTPRPAAIDAQDRGVIFDVGHGSGSFSFEVAETFISYGRKSQVISTDVHQMSVYGPMFNLPTTMSKMLHCGMSLEEVVAATTCNPARVLGRESEMGMLAVGQKADIAVFEFVDGPFRLFDSQHNVRTVERVLTNVATIKDGGLLPQAKATPPPDWVQLTEPQRALANMDPQPRNVLSAGPFDSPQSFVSPPRTEWSK